MPRKQPLAKRAQAADVVYLYDGTFPGFLCCVFESVYAHEIPAAIYPEHEAQPTLYQTRLIETEMDKATRVEKSIPKKIGPRARELVQMAFLSGSPQKELDVLRFLLLGYKEGRKTPYMMGHPDVAPVLDMERNVGHEAHLYKGFTRFGDYDGVLAGAISPKNFVLPLLAEHFTMRFPNEEFLLFDKTHRAALVWQNTKAEVVPMHWIDFPVADEEEQQYRALWKQFYKTIAIEARVNPRCRRTNMPKRYWPDMLEVAEELLRK